MPKPKPKSNLKKFVIFLLGCTLLVCGITLVLSWWNDIVVLAKGALGIVLALVGLLILNQAR